MLVLLENSNQQWICSLCRHERDHKAIGSKENPNCTACGMSITKTVRYYVVSWLRGLLSKAGFGTDNEKSVMQCNFGQLAERLFNPHREQVGMLRPF